MKTKKKITMAQAARKSANNSLRDAWGRLNGEQCFKDGVRWAKRQMKSK